MSGEAELIGGDARFDELMKRLRAAGIGKAVSASEWQEVVDFLDENILTEDRIQKEYDCGHGAGIEQATTGFKKALMDKAAELFTDSNDEQAKFVRNLATKLKL